MSNDTYKTSATLIGRVKSGDEDAWNDLVKLYQKFLVFLVEKEGIPKGDTMDEIIQQVLVAVRQGIDKFELRENLVSWRPWIRTITKSKVKDFFRKQNRYDKKIELVGQEAELEMERAIKKVTSKTWDKDEEIDQKQDEVERALLLEATVDILHERTKISKRDLMIFYQCTCTDREYASIAEEYEMKPGAIATIKSRVMSRIKENERYTHIAQAIGIDVSRRNSSNS